MDQIMDHSVQTKIISGTIFRLIEIRGIATNGNPFHKIIRRIGEFYMNKTYHIINNQYVLVNCITNLGDDQFASLVFEANWENNWWPNDSGDQ